MFQNTKNLLKKPIYTLDTGKLIGEIKDVYVDAQLVRLQAVFLGKEGLFNRKEWVLSKDRIQLMGLDAWFVSTETVVRELKELENASELVTLSDLRNRPVTTQSGTPVGTVGDLLLNEQGEIKGLALAKVQVQGPLAETKQLVRSAITFVGDKSRPMIVDLAVAEHAATIPA
jgi:sporulation protein YlmC with PRC-barrel domain